MSRTSGGANSSSAARNAQPSTAGSQSSSKPLTSRNSVSNSPSPRPTVSASASQSATSSHSTGGHATVLLKNLKALLGQSVKLSLEDGHDMVGLLWSYDLSMGLVALEIPRTAATHLLGGLTYPSKAVAAPTAISSSVKVAAQGGDASGARSSFELIKIRRVQHVQRLQSGEPIKLPGAKTAAALTVNQALLEALDPSKITIAKTDINIAAAEAREKAATAEALKRAAKIGVGVSTLGQQVFDALNKTLPCRWSDRHIIVMDEFAISPEQYDTVTVPNVPTSTLQAAARGEKVANAPADIGSQATRWQRVTKVLEGERKRLLAAPPATK